MSNSAKVKFSQPEVLLKEEGTPNQDQEMTSLHLVKKDSKPLRNVERRTVFSIHYSLSPELYFNDNLINAEFKNITFSGACIAIHSKDIPNLKNKENQLRLNIKQGKKIFNHDISFRVAWENKTFGHLIGIEFVKSELPYSRKDERFLVDVNHKPTFFFNDPLEPKRKIYGQVCDLSSNGFSITTSLTNKHLFEGMKVKGVLNTIENTTNLEVRLRNVKLIEDKIRVGFEINNNADYIKVFKKYLATFCFEYPLDSDPPAKNLGDAITFYRIESQEDYLEVLNLRREAYGSKGKVNERSEETLNLGLQNEGIVLGGYINNNLVCSVEFRVKSEGHTCLLEKYIDINDLPYPPESLFEINKLCIHSKVQKSDVLLTIFNKLHLYALNNGEKNVILSTTPELQNIYERLGAKKTKFSYPHPYLPDKELGIMVIETQSYIQGEKLNPFLWKMVYEDIHNFASDHYLTKELKISLRKKLVLKTSSWLYSRNKKNKDKSKKPSGEASVLKHTKTDFSTQIILPYLKAASVQINPDYVEKMLKDFGFDLAYFENPNNWISVDLFDDILTTLSRKIDLNDLSILAGEMAMRKEILGAGYYVLKYFANIDFFLYQIKNTTSKLNNNRYVTIEKISSNSIITNFHLKEGCRLPASRTVDVNFQTLIHHGVALSFGIKKSDVTVDQIASAYDYKGPTRFKITWKAKSTKLKSAVVISAAAVSTATFYHFPQHRLEFLASMFSFSVLKIFIDRYNYGNAFKDLDSFYQNVEDNSKKQYDVLHQAKTELESHRNRLELINGISREIHGSRGINHILETSAKLICESFNFSRCAILLKDEDNFLRTKNLYSREPNEYLNILWKFAVDLNNNNIKRKVVSTSFHSRQTVFIRDVSQMIEDLSDFSQELVQKLNTKSYVICPICTEEEIHGVVIADKGLDTTHEITPLEIQTLEEISVTLAVAISKQKRFDDLNETLSVLKRYNPKVFADNKIDHKKTNLAGSRSEVISGFLDVRGFTTISETYPPEVTIDIINTLASLCEKALDKKVGHIDKFIGDEFFITWEGATPEELAESAYATVREIKFQLEKLNIFNKKRNYPLIEVGIGLDYGQVIRGNIGTEDRMDFTSIGPSVNKAARLQALNKDFDSYVTVSEVFYNLLTAKDKTELEKEKVQIRGFQKEEFVFLQRNKRWKKLSNM